MATAIWMMWRQRWWWCWFLYIQTTTCKRFGLDFSSLSFHPWWCCSICSTGHQFWCLFFVCFALFSATWIQTPNQMKRETLLSEVNWRWKKGNSIFRVKTIFLIETIFPVGHVAMWFINFLFWYWLLLRLPFAIYLYQYMKSLLVIGILKRIVW